MRRGLAFGLSAFLCLGAIGAGVAYATSRSETAMAPGTARLVPGDAAVTVHRGSPTAAADAPLRSGDRLTVTRGTAIVQTATGRLFARMGTTITFGDTSPRIVRGDVLAVGQHMRLATQPANLIVDGVGRIRQELSLEVATYQGVTSVRTAVDEYALDALRRVVVVGAGGSTSARMSPLTIDGADSWDRQYLGVALELDRGLNARSRGISLQSDGTGAAVKSRVLTAISQWTDLMPLGETSVGDAVVAAELATAAHLDTDGLRQMLLNRSEGASWGLIAYELGLTKLPNELPGIDEAAMPATPQTTLVVAPVATTPTTTPGRTFIVPGAGPVTTTPPPTTTPTTAPEPVVVDPLGGLVGGLGNVLGGLLGAK